MEKGDRYVTIYIGQSCTTINVYPWEKEEPARWIHDSKTGYSECPECGSEVEPESYDNYTRWPNYCSEGGKD